MEEKNTIQAQLQEVCRRFRIPGTLTDWKQLTSGNINTTYKVNCVHEGQQTAYLVQRVNTYVFKDPVQMMRNIDLITSHLMKKNEAAGITDRRSRLHFHHTEEGDNYIFLGEEGEQEFWRLSNYVEDALSFDSSDDPRVLRMAGKAFGRFEAQLSDFDAAQLFEVIPNFHNTRLRLETLFGHVQEDPCQRCAEVQEEINAIAKARDFACQLNEKLDRGELFYRVTHNDTKTNNVLFDKDTLEPVNVIDLDTVMPGLAAHDFGDTVRFAANTAEEDEADLSKVSLDLDLFRAFAEGYIGETAGFLTEAELDSMALGAATITLEQASRFLDDYITGDKYFKTNYPGHNLVRTRCQLALFADMMEKYEEMDRIVHEVAAEAKKGENEHVWNYGI